VTERLQLIRDRCAAEPTAAATGCHLRQQGAADDEIRSGWMTTGDAELLDVLARALTDDERRQVAETGTRADTQADQPARRR
jgi:hypothetical protein